MRRQNARRDLLQPKNFSPKQTYIKYKLESGYKPVGVGLAKGKSSAL
jgi:hypothetical protein